MAGLLIMLDAVLNLRSLLLLLAMVQGVVVALLLTARGIRQRSKADYILATLLLTLGFSLVSHFIGFMGIYDYAREHGWDLTFFPFSNELLYGPLCLLYTLSLTDSEFEWRPRHLLWLLPAALYYTIYMSIWLLTPEAEKRFLGDGELAQQLSLAESGFYYLLTGWFLVQAYRRISQYEQLIHSEYSNLDKITLHWLKAFLYAFSGYMLVDLSFSISSLFGTLGYAGWYWLNLIRAFLLYYISVTGWAFAHKSEVQYHLLQTRKLQLEQLAPAPEAKESTRTELIPADELARRREHLAQYFTQQKPWLDPELTLSQLATNLNLNTTVLSYVINTGFGKNFNDLINAYRVEEVKNKMSDPAYAHLSLLGIAFSCGFNSKATFNRAFKKATGMAPSMYK